MEALSAGTLRGRIDDDRDAKIASAFPDFVGWFAEIRKELRPDYVVAIARGAVRILQLLDLGRDTDQGTLISDQALPFLKDNEIKGAKVLLFDDSLVFGSTMVELYEYLTARGAHTVCAAYIVDVQNFLGQNRSSDRTNPPSPHSWLPLRSKHLAFPEFVRSHHSALVEAVLRSPLGYNPDFPTYRLTIPKYPPGDIPYIVSRLCSSVALRDTSDVSLPAAPQFGIWRYTAFLRSIPTSLFPSKNAILRPHSKLRIAFIPEKGEIRLTPIVQLAIPIDARFESIQFSHPTTQKLWRSMIPPATSQDPFYFPALSRLLTAYTSLLVGEFLIQDVRKTLAKDLDVEDVTLLTDDQRLTLGDANGDRLISIRTALNGSTIVDLDKAGLPFPESEEPPNAPEIRRRIVEVWKSNPRIKPSPNDLTTEAVAKILLTLKGTADSTKSRLYDSTAKRLQIGLSCESIRKLMEECGLHVSLDSISLAVDTCVDSGPAVPKIVCEDGFWFRAFYSGEASDSDHCAQFKSAFHVGYQELRKSKKRGRPLTPFDVQKLCVCLKDLCPFLPLARYFHTFGACVNVGTDRKDLIQWLVDSDVREVSPVTKTSDGSKELLESNPYFEPCMLETWTPQQRREFSEAFHYLGTAFQRLPDDAKLLLSTCCNHHETFGAVAFEAYSWAERPRSNFGFVLSSVRTDLSRRGALQHESISAMYWVVQFIAECRRKLHVFDKSHSILEKLNAEFKRQGPSAQVFWEYVKGRGTINLARDPAIVYRMEMLRPVLTQMTLLTTFFIKVLEAAGLLTEGHLYDELKRHGLRSDDRHVQWLEVTARDAASSYNEYVRTSPEPLDAHCKALLPLGRLLPPAAGVDEWCRRQIVQTRECFNEIVAVLQDFCPRYDVTTGESEYAPNAMRRRRKGAVEIDKEGVYVLSVALGGSFDRGFRDRFYMRIDQAVRNFEVLLFEENKHGHFTVAAVEVGKIFRIISVIQEIEFGVGPKAGSQYKMRMAIAYGPMTMVLKDTGERALRGTRRSHPLAQVKILLREFRRSKADLGRTKDVLLLTNEAYRAMAGIPSAPQALRAAQVIPGPNPYMSDYLVELPI